MKIFESVFDIAYLITVIGLGIKLLLERKEDYKLFTIMAIIIAKMPPKADPCNSAFGSILLLLNY